MKTNCCQSCTAESRCCSSRSGTALEGTVEVFRSGGHGLRCRSTPCDICGRPIETDGVGCVWESAPPHPLLDECRSSDPLQLQPACAGSRCGARGKATGDDAARRAMQAMVPRRGSPGFGSNPEASCAGDIRRTGEGKAAVSCQRRNKSSNCYLLCENIGEAWQEGPHFRLKHASMRNYESNAAASAGAKWLLKLLIMWQTLTCSIAHTANSTCTAYCDMTETLSGLSTASAHMPDWDYHDELFPSTDFSNEGTDALYVNGTVSNVSNVCELGFSLLRCENHMPWYLPQWCDDYDGKLTGPHLHHACRRHMQRNDGMHKAMQSGGSRPAPFCSTWVKYYLRLNTAWDKPRCNNKSGCGNARLFECSGIEHDVAFNDTAGKCDTGWFCVFAGSNYAFDASIWRHNHDNAACKKQTCYLDYGKIACKRHLPRYDQTHWMSTAMREVMQASCKQAYSLQHHANPSKYLGYAVLCAMFMFLCVSVQQECVFDYLYRVIFDFLGGRPLSKYAQACTFLYVSGPPPY